LTKAIKNIIGNGLATIVIASAEKEFYPLDDRLLSING
jgi:Na+/H+-dicarboxylate symporter